MWQNQPFKIEVKSGEKKAFCNCALTSNPPFCDGSHKRTDITPTKITFEEDKTIYICGCRKSNNLPFCDGTHKKS